MIAERIKSNIMTLKTLGTGGWVYYAWHGRSNREIPYFLAMLCRRRVPKGYVRIDSYDGSGQCVHPDIIEYKNDLYLAFTPYPYGVDNYENPQVAIWDKKNNVWKTIIKEPFVKPQNPERFHYSDTFLFVQGERLLYFYRISDKENDSKSIIYYVELDGDHICEEKQITGSYDYTYTSPFIIGYNGLHFFHIESGTPNKMYVRDFESFGTVIDSSVPLKEVRLDGFGENEWLWHLGVSSINDYNQKNDESGCFFGIATCIMNGQYDYYFDVLCKLFYSENEWVLKKISVLKPNANGGGYKYAYKGCVCRINGKQYAYMTIVDQKFRHGIYCLPLEGACNE